MCVCVCVYVCMYTYVHTHTHAQTHRSPSGALYTAQKHKASSQVADVHITYVYVSRLRIFQNHKASSQVADHVDAHARSQTVQGGQLSPLLALGRRERGGVVAVGVGGDVKALVGLRVKLVDLR